MIENLQEIKKCLACDHDNLKMVLDLNNQPLANSYKNSKDAVEDSFPLAIKVCQVCHHVQLTHIVNPDLIYKNYLYVSGTTKTYVDYMDWYAKFCIEKLGHAPSSVLDIGCNDGSQLDKFKALNVDTYGVDPAENLYETSSKNHKVTCGYFDDKYNRSHNIITIQNAFAHNPNPLELLKNCKKNLEIDGLLFIQTSQADMILNNEFDTIYHEHISYYNIKSMMFLCNRAGLNLIDVVKTPIHGTSYIFIISADRSAPSTIKNLVEMETAAGLYDNFTYTKYTSNCIEKVANFAERVEYWRDQGYKIVGYGAPAKGNTFLNFARIPLDIIIDDNKLKQGLFTPGSSIEIVGSEILGTYTEDDKVLFIPLAWNFFKEIKQRILSVRNNPNDIFLNIQDL
jgi:2-polyprenyl-3-methyl-5-hydroxy-6-metoxy-1,4-benzoquinol methylase